jgi:hypothetical protein
MQTSLNLDSNLISTVLFLFKVFFALADKMSGAQDMLSVSGIGQSYLSQALYNSQGTSSTETSDSTQTSSLSASDIVTLSSESIDLLKSLLDSTSDESSSSIVSGDAQALLEELYNSSSDETSSKSTLSDFQGLLSSFLNSTGDDSSSTIYDILIASQNEKLIKSNPNLVNMILATEDTSSTDSSSTALSTSDDINLVTMSANEILNIIEKYKKNSSTTTETSSSLVDKTV